MREGIQGEVGPILQGRPWLEPRDGQAAARVLCGEGPMVRGVAVEGGRLHRRGKAGRSGVNFRGGAKYPEGGEATFVPQEEVHWGKTGLAGQYIGGGTEEAIRGPPLDLVPEGGEFSQQVEGGGEDVRAVAEDREEERGGQSAAQKGGKAHPPGGEPFYGHKGSLSFGQSLGEVRRGGQQGGKPVSQPPDLIFGFEDRAIEVDRSVGYWASVPVRTPVDELRLGDRETDAEPGPSGLQPGVLPLEDLDVATIGRRGCRVTKVIHVGESEAQGDLRV